MPQGEDEIKDSETSNSPAKIAAWWNNFHFSGRVIMCSVLFGLGLILIGGLIFAINMGDDAKKNGKAETIDELPTKAPSGYVGPVVIGIGGFIVIVGVIMCLFETQVCRKKTADAKPLISDKNEDVEAKGSNSTEVPSSSRYHKHHNHKSRKISSSPRKTKSKHAKPHSHEQKQTPVKSPPVFIDKSKSFTTSSEENFLTPPNTMDEQAALVHKSSREAEIQTSSSLMKSFTSSGTWNQSTEFLTPNSSLKDNSISIDNSVELSEKQAQVNFKIDEVPNMTSTHEEFNTPVTKEEENIQKMFIQVKNEHMKTGEEQPEENVPAAKVISEHRNDVSVINAENNADKKVENFSKNDSPLVANPDILTVKETTEKSLKVLEEFGKKNSANEKNICSDNFSALGNDSDEFVSNKNEVSASSNVTACTPKNEKDDVSKNDIPPSCDSIGITRSENGSISEQSDEKINSLPSHIKELKNVSKSEMSNESNMQLDLENSMSSEETLVSHDNSTEIPKCNDDQTKQSTSEKYAADKSKTSDVSESLKEDQSSNSTNHQNSLTDIQNVEKIGASDLNANENDLKKTETTDEKSVENSS